MNKGKRKLKAPLCKPGYFCFECPYHECIAPFRNVMPTAEEAEMLAKSGITIVWAKMDKKNRGV
ncbi:MAG: hypothetical protein J5908_12250 [Selenomonas sp.]|nr:hypothetical protein [Selenomonas sp.]